MMFQVEIRDSESNTLIKVLGSWEKEEQAIEAAESYFETEGDSEFEEYQIKKHLHIWDILSPEEK